MKNTDKKLEQAKSIIQKMHDRQKAVPTSKRIDTTYIKYSRKNN